MSKPLYVLLVIFPFFFCFFLVLNGCDEEGGEDSGNGRGNPNWNAPAAGYNGSYIDSDDDDDNDDNNDNDDDDFTAPTPLYGYYQEGDPPDWTWCTAQLPVFAQYDLTLFLGMDLANLGDPNLKKFLLAADAQGVNVRAWLLLPYADGYWPGEKNATLFAQTAIDFAQWFLDENIPIEWIVVDMETDINTMGALTDALANGDYLSALMILLGNIDPQSFQQAEQIYRQLVEDLSNMGFYSMVVTAPMVIDDINDGDTFLQDVLDIPVSSIPWHEVSPMVYTTTFDDMIGLDFGPYLTYDYALSTVEYFGEGAASIALGISGEMGDPAILATEIAAAKAAGIERIQVYNYRGVADETNPDLWHQAFDTPADTPPLEPATTLIRGLLRLADIIF